MLHKVARRGGKRSWRERRMRMACDRIESVSHVDMSPETKSEAAPFHTLVRSVNVGGVS